ncbi:fimbrillin family protein, partial [Bacteroides sp. OttesenSCG-928-N06]|nr:fimbrillin family protein [Bacteroides sp. OttesenSCG-928-N06]
MKKKTIAALAIVATTLASCINDDIVQDIDNANRTPLELTAGINTRATDATWNRADAIGVFTLATGTNTIAQGVSNFKYTNTADDGAEAIFAPANEENTAYYPINGDKVDVLAYYPYKQLTMDNGQLTIPVSVASQANLPAIDLMTAERVTGKHYDDAAVPLEFVHRLTKLNITLKKANEAAEIDLADARITIGGTPTTAVYNLNTQTFESFGEKADIELAAGGTGIVIPTAAGSGVNFKVEASGKTFTVTLPDNAALGSGEEAYITIKLRTFTEATITATIRPWTGGPTTAVEAVHFTLPNHPQTGAPEVTDFILYKNRGTNTEAFVDYSYNTYTAEWDATPAPFYIEDIKSGDTFTAVHTPQGEDPITGVTDVLQAPEATMVGGIINLEFAHINARLNVNLRKGESVGDIDLTTAQVSLLGYKLTGAGNTIVVNPGSIAAGTIGVKVGDKDFTVTHDAIALAAGTDNTLNITLSSRQDGKTIGGVEATVKAWTVVPAKELTAVNLTTPVDPVTGEPEVTTFTLYKNKGEGEVSVDYTYNTATKEWTANPAPFYVEDITATDKFTAVHTPAAGDAITGVKDVLEAAEVGMDLGTGVISLTFAHVNARLNVNLRKGTGAEAVN